MKTLIKAITDALSIFIVIFAGTMLFGLPVATAVKVIMWIVGF